MFNKLKHLKDMRSQAKTMQNALAEEKIDVEKNGVKLNLNGNMEILDLQITEDMDKEKTAKAVKEAVNDGIKKAQKVMAKKMQENGGMPGFGG